MEKSSVRFLKAFYGEIEKTMTPIHFRSNEKNTVDLEARPSVIVQCMFDSSFYETTGTFFFSLQPFLGMREKKKKKGRRQEEANNTPCSVWESSSPPSSSSCLQLSLSADQLSPGHPHLVEPKFRRNDHRFQELSAGTSTTQIHPSGPPPPDSYYYSTLISLSGILYPPIFFLNLLLFFSGSYDNTEMNCRPRLQSSSSSPRLHQLLSCISDGAPQS